MTYPSNAAHILPAEFIGKASHSPAGVLRIGEGEHVVELKLSKGSRPGWWNDSAVSVYVRRLSSDLSIMEIHIARHDGLAAEEMEAQNEYGSADG
jgi:hypothetical protein